MSGVLKSIICNGCTICIMAYIYIYIDVFVLCDVACLNYCNISTFYVVGLTAL